MAGVARNRVQHAAIAADITRSELTMRARRFSARSSSGVGAKAAQAWLCVLWRCVRARVARSLLFRWRAWPCCARFD